MDRGALDHTEAGGSMNGRSQALIAFALAGLVVAGAVLAERIGVADRSELVSAEAVSHAWLCPHGGGRGWDGRLAVANPGEVPVVARVTSLGKGGSGEPATFTVPAGGEFLHEMRIEDRASSTYVEVFGGWAAAGWLVRADGREKGIGVEPCAPAASRHWCASELTTQRGEAGFLIIMNPFASDAVFDVTLYTPDRPPFRDPDWVDISVPAGSSKALQIDKLVPGEDSVGAEVVVKSGRVAVATLGVSEEGGVRSALGSASLANRWYLPTASGAGQSYLAIFVPGEDSARFGAKLLSEQLPQPAGGLVEQEQSMQSVRTYPVATTGASVIDLLIGGDGSVVPAMRTQGLGWDDAATTGAAQVATSWVVLPSAAEEPSEPSLAIVNPGDQPVDATLRLLPSDGGVAPITTTIQIPPTSVVEAETGFMSEMPDAAVLVEASGDVIVFGASTSGGREGLALYGIALGIPVPPERTI